MSDSAANLCEECKGTGMLFKQQTQDTRVQLACPVCGGSGQMGDSVLRVLTGEAQTALSKSSAYYEAAKGRFRKFDGTSR